MGLSILRSVIVWYESDGGRGIHSRSGPLPAAKAGTVTLYVNSNRRVGTCSASRPWPVTPMRRNTRTRLKTIRANRDVIGEAPFGRAYVSRRPLRTLESDNLRRTGGRFNDYVTDFGCGGRG